jgi:hypothetical protein
MKSQVLIDSENTLAYISVKTLFRVRFGFIFSVVNFREQMRSEPVDRLLFRR